MKRQLSMVSEKLLLFLVCFILSHNSYAQSIKQLDNKYGYKDISFNDSLDKWKDKVEIRRNDKTIGIMAFMKDLSNYSFAGYNAMQVMLTFNSEDYSLESITVELAFQKADVPNGKYILYSLDEFLYVSNVLEDLFGKQEQYVRTGTDIIFRKWRGEKVELLFYYEHRGISSYDTGTMIIRKIDKESFEF